MSGTSVTTGLKLTDNNNVLRVLRDYDLRDGGGYHTVLQVIPVLRIKN